MYPKLQPFNPVKRLGFSLIELLVVCALLSILGTALYTTFYQGVNLWKRSQSERGEFRDIFFTEKLTQDLRNAISMAGHSIKGESSEFEFYALLSAAELGFTQNSRGLQFPCKVRYYWSRSQKKVYREIQSYSQLLADSKKTLKTSTVLEGADVFKLKYMEKNKRATILWQRVWEKERLPDAVSVSIKYDYPKNFFKRVITVPAGGRSVQTGSREPNL